MQALNHSFGSRYATASATAALALTAVCFGLVPLFARELQAGGTDSATIAFYRYAFSALAMLPFLPREREKRGEALLLGGAGLAMGLSWIGYLDSLKTVPVATAGVVYMSYPLFTLLFAWLMAGQRPGLRSALSAALVLLAAAAALPSLSVLLDAANAAQLSALLWALPAPLAFGFAIVVLCTRVHRLNAMERMGAAMLGAALGLLPLALSAETGPIVPASTSLWLPIAGMALATALIPQLIYSYAAPLVGPARSAATGSFELPTMFAVGWLAFGETIGLREIAAAVLVTAAVLLAPAIAPPRDASKKLEGRELELARS